MQFRTFVDADYEDVCTFLIELNRKDRRHIHWNWARFEWMYEHPEFDKSAVNSIGLWLDGGRIVGAAIYDMYFGEAFCGVLPEYGEVFPEVLDYAYRALKDEAGLALALCDENAGEIAVAENAGFAKTAQTETIMAISLEQKLPAALPEGLWIREMDQVKDIEALLWLFWQGFDHGTDRAEFERSEEIVPQIRPHFNKSLSLAAVDPSGEPVSFCGLWFCPGTDYAYVEPVCTVPAYRGKGAARALLYEAMNRAGALGAKRAYVISDQVFYEKLGFEKVRTYTFYRR